MTLVLYTYGWARVKAIELRIDSKCLAGTTEGKGVCELAHLA